VSLLAVVNVVDNLFGKFEIDYSVIGIKDYEKFSIYIDGALKCNISFFI
jgi:hypothetical protein